MIRALLKLVLVVVILAAAAAFFVGYKLSDGGVETPVSATVPAVDTAKARETEGVTSVVDRLVVR